MKTSKITLENIKYSDGWMDLAYDLFQDKINEQYSDEDEAYYLGLLYADGNVTQRSFSIALQEGDVHIIESLKKDLKSQAKIGTVLKKKEHHQNQRRIFISNKKMVSDLITLGCIPNKSNTISTFKNYVPFELRKYFILGYFDGDGGLNQDKRGCNSFKWSIVGNYGILHEMREHLDMLGIFRNANCLNQGSHELKFSLDYSNYRSCKELFDLFYDFKSPFLLRKYESFKLLLNEFSGNKNIKSKINQLDKNRVLIKEWDSMALLKEQLQLTDVSKIYKCLNGLHKTSMNYIWEYKND